MKTKLFTLLLAVAASVGTMFAWDYERVQIGDLYYNLDATNQTAEVTSQIGSIPYWSTTITTAIIPASVEYNSMTYSVTSIGNDAFSGCSGLTSIEIPNSVTSIGYNAFAFCTGLTSVVVDNNNSTYDSRNNCNAIIETATNTLIAGCKKSIIPSSVTSIGSNAFYGCTGLTSIEIPNSVTSIGNDAFSGCSGLTSIEIPNSVTSIGNYAFRDCTGLTSIEIPNSVTSIGNDAFRDCTGLTSITIPEGVTSLGSYVFERCKNLKTIELPSTLVIGNTSSYYYKFGGGFRLDTLRIAANMLSYGETQTDKYYKNIRYTLAGFYSYDGLDKYDTTNVYQNIKYIEAPYWFFDVQEQDWSKCAKNIETIIVNRGELNDNVLGVLARQSKTLKTLDISGVTNLPDRAFVDFYNLQSIALPANIEKIGYKALAECVKLQSIDIPASVVEIDDRAFEDCRSIKTITFGGAPAGAPGRFNAPAASTSLLRRIGNWAFYNAHELQHLDIPEGVTEIGDGAFYGCTYLEEMVLPSSVQEIGDNTFALCSKLKKIVVNAVTPPSVQAKTFYDVKRQIPVYVPDESVDAYKNDAYWQEFDIQGRSNMPQGLEEISSSLQGGDRGRLIYHNGQIYILRGNKTYTLQGQEVK